MITALFATGVLALQAPGADQDYFPAHLLEPVQTCQTLGASARRAPMSASQQEWYARHLRAAGEPSLQPVAGPAPSSLRFTWLPSFHQPVIVRIQWTDDGARMIARRLSGHGGYDPGDIADEIERPLEPAEAAQVQTALDHLRESAPDPVDCALGLDGAQWVIETNEDGEYDFLDRWSPSDGPVRNLGETLLALTGWTFQQVY